MTSHLILSSLYLSHVKNYYHIIDDLDIWLVLIVIIFENSSAFLHIRQFMCYVSILSFSHFLYQWTVIFHLGIINYVNMHADCSNVCIFYTCTYSCSCEEGCSCICRWVCMCMYICLHSCGIIGKHGYPFSKAIHPPCLFVEI